MRKIIYIFMMLLVLMSCKKNTRIKFNDSINEVSSSMLNIADFIEMNSKTGIKNIFVDNNDIFYINNTSIGLFKESNSEDLVNLFKSKYTRIEMEFLLRDFNQLMRNDISSVFIDPVYNQIFFTYNRSPENSYIQMRLLTFNIDFEGFDDNFEVLDTKEDLFLIAPK